MNGTSHKAARWGRVTVAILFVLSLVWAQPIGTSAEDNLGEEAIGAALDSLSPDPEPTEEPPAESTEGAPAESSEPPPAEEPAAEPASDEPAASEDESPPADDSSTSSDTASNETAAPAASEVSAFENPAPAGQAAGATEAAPASDGSISLEQSAIENATNSGGDSGRRSSNQNDEPKSLTQTAARNVLSGNSALGGALPVNGGSGVNNDDRPREATALQSAGDNLAPSTISPRRNRSERRNNENDPEDNGTVVVNSLSDSGDQGKLAVHGRFVAGTLCDGSQFWSLDGGGSVNANGINLSANGGTALSSADGGDDNLAGGNGSAAGNGGRANSSADGGIVVVQELNTGNNRGNEVTVGGQSYTGDCGQGVIDGGDATTINNVNISADGGTALASANGGDDNIAGGGGNAGNGGRANASADGGIVIVGTLDLGGNQGNSVNATGNPGAGGCLLDGGSVRNINNIDISADGGTALASADGGDDNIAVGEDANAGNGGRARANADGGLILAGDIITGNNSGNTINADCGAGGSGGRVVVNGGSVLNETNINLNADGGTAIADASGGDGNIAFGLGPDGDANAGNGGRARSDASGGRIEVGNIVTGNNTGNVIAVGSSFVQGRTPDSSKPEKIRKIKKQAAQPAKPSAGSPKASAPAKGKAPANRSAKGVGQLPNTGTGSVAGSSAATLLLFGGLAAVVAAAMAQASPRRRTVVATIERRSGR